MRLVVILAGILWLASSAHLWLNGQTVTGTILGTVTDASGDRVPNAVVKAVNSLTGETRATVTNTQGDYIFPVLPVGQYRVETQVQGFKQSIHQGVSLDVNQNARLDVRLEIGQVNQEVIVASDAPQVDTRQVQIGGLMDTKRINDLPLNGRNVYSLVELLPGVSGSSLQSQPDSATGSNINVNGSRQMQSTFMLDGGFHNAVFRNGGLVAPNPDTVEEFRLITSNYNAEYGRSAGGVVNVITKSGANRWHGSLFEFLRNDALDARSFFQPSVSKLRQNQFGGSVSGPVRRDKLFFFYSYQGDRIRNGQFVNAARTPTEAQRRGDFSAVPANQRPRDPNTNQPFSNGIIPGNRLDPVSLNILKLVALPTTPDGRVEASSNASQNSNQHFGKVDYLLNAAHRASVSTFLLRGDNYYPFSNQFLISNIPNYAPQTYNAHQNSVTANETWTVGPSLLNQFTFSYVGVPTERADTNRVGWPDFGSRFVLGALPVRPPRFVVTNGWTAGSNGDVFETDNTYLFSDVLAWVRGAHSIKAGGSLFYLKFNYNGTSRAAGLINVGSEFTGNPFSDFLLGRSTSFDTSNAFTPNLRSKNWAGFFQDDWKVSRKITLNLGLRYEVFTPYVDVNDRLQQFRFNQQSKIYPNAPRGLVFPGDEGVPRGLVNTDWNNFAPRVGIAIDAFGNGKTAVRAGYGVFYSVGFAGMANSNVGQPFQIDVIAFGTPSFVDPYANAGGNPFPIPAGGARFVLPVQAAWMDNMRTPYVQQYNFTIQQQLMRNLTLEAGYVGNTSRKLELQRDANQPVYLPGRSTAANVNDRRPFSPGAFAVISDQQSGANANYNALQATLNRRFAHGFTLLANYTWSKAIDTQSADQQSVGALPFVDSNNTNLDRGRSGLDLPHAFNLSLLWEMPRISRWGLVGKRLLSGWQINAIARYTSGRPFTVTSGRDSNLNGVNNDRPDLLRNPKLDNGRPRDERLLKYFDPAAFQFAATGANGTAGRNTLYGPESSNWNTSFFKNFPIVEKHQLQFRAEFFNFLNHASFGNPVSNLGNANVGRILGASGGRIIQFGLRYSF